MERWFCLIPILFFSFISSSSQDIIFKNNGKKIICKITKEDSLNVFYTRTQNSKEINSSLSRGEIQKITHVTKLPYISNSDSIIIRNKLVYFRGTTVEPNKLEELLGYNVEAARKYQSAKSSGRLGYIFSFVGSFCLGWPVGTAIAGGDPEWELAGIGAGLCAASLVFSINAVKRTKEAFNIYNQGISKTTYLRKQIRVGFSGNGLSLCMQF